MAKIGRNDTCPCGSGKKYKKCCINKKPRQQEIYVGTKEPIKGLYYDKDKMQFTGITKDNRKIEAQTTFSQTMYVGDSGKEKVTSRIQEKVIPDKNDLFRHLSSFDLTIGIDTNTKTINSKQISATGIIHFKLIQNQDRSKYTGTMHGPSILMFRDCPKELHPEKLAWLMIIKKINKSLDNVSKRFALATDHDLGNHIPFTKRQKPIFRNTYLPDNFTLMYGRGDGSSDNILNDLIKRCDKTAAEVLYSLENNGFYESEGRKILLDQIPKPNLTNYEKNNLINPSPGS